MKAMDQAGFGVGLGLGLGLGLSLGLGLHCRMKTIEHVEVLKLNCILIPSSIASSSSFSSVSTPHPNTTLILTVL